MWENKVDCVIRKKLPRWSISKIHWCWGLLELEFTSCPGGKIDSPKFPPQKGEGSPGAVRLDIYLDSILYRDSCDMWPRTHYFLPHGSVCFFLINLDRLCVHHITITSSGRNRSVRQTLFPAPGRNQVWNALEAKENFLLEAATPGETRSPEA